jgi:crotonobetainyl-CoA:carnitine CoA-transferase CaiB-like acyl-CoA transferase
LVQTSTGIAAAGRAAAHPTADGPPVPLPVQALDHSIGYLLAAGVLRALTTLRHAGRLTEVRGALVGASNVLAALPATLDEAAVPKTTVRLLDDDTAWGPVRRVPAPTVVDGYPAGWRRPAGPVASLPASAISWPTE